MPLYRELRTCDGWPELGSCGRYAMRYSSYCADCEALRRAHGEPEEVFEYEDDMHDTRPHERAEED